MRLMVNMFGFHNRKKFEIHAFSYGHGQADKLHERLVKGFDAFHNAHEIPDQEFVELIQSKGIDILIDLTGFTQYCRSNVLACRAAPIQVSYLGYPGSMGMEAIDYIIADNILVPEESRKFYSEKIIYMPHCYQVSDNQRVIPVTHSTRIDEGLPDKEFVFCCFSENRKITPHEFDIWIRLLNNVEGSVLWLMQSNQWSEANLKKEAKARGLNPARLIFAEPCEYSEYLERMTKADLFLDTFNYNAGAIANDALWCGLPILTKQGQSYAARMASSLLNCIDLPELITTNEKDYEQVALELATNPNKLKLIKEKLSLNKEKSPLFDTKRFTRNIETAYMQIYANYFAGEKPKHLFIEEHETH
jgi:predicted O-linked N-acetylglucosamine transferase (SPINDLY family)